MNSCTGEAITVKENGTEGRERERETQMKLKLFSLSLFHKRIAAHSQNKTRDQREKRFRSVYPLTQSSLLPSAPSSPLSYVLHPERKISQDD